LVLLEVGVALGAGEDSGGGAGLLDGGGAEGGTEGDGALEVGTFEEAADDAGIEGVAAAGAIDIVDGKDTRAATGGGGECDGTVFAAGDDDGFGSPFAEETCLFDGRVEAGHQFGFIGIGEEVVCVGEDGFEWGGILAGAGDDDIEDSFDTTGASDAEPFDDGGGGEFGHGEIAADIEDAGLEDLFGGEFGAVESGGGTEGMNEASVLAFDIDDEGAAGFDVGGDLEGGGIDACGLHGALDEFAEDVLAESGDDADIDLLTCEVDGDIGGAASDGEFKPIGEDEFPGFGKVVDGVAEVIGESEADGETVPAGCV